MIKTLFLFFFLVFIVSCSTLDPIHLKSDLNKSMLSGKIISEDGLPLEGVLVKLNDIQKTNSDINGKFLFNFLRFGKYTITFSKKDFAPTDYSFKYNFKNRKLPFIKIKMQSMNFLVNEGFEYLKEQNYAEAEKIIAKLKKINSKEEIVLYLQATKFYLEENYTEAMPILEKLKSKDRKNIYYQLTLVDVYEKLELHEKTAKLSFYIGISNPKLYLEYIKKSAQIYKDKLNNEKEYEKTIKAYDKYKKIH